MTTIPETAHIPFEVLADYAEGRLSTDSAAGVAAHLAGCARCAADAGWLRQTIRLMGSDDWEEAPPELVQAVILAFAPAPHPAITARRRASVWLPLIAVAVLILIGLGIGLGDRGRPGALPATYAAAELPTPLPPAAVVTQQAGLVEIKRASSAAWQPTAADSIVQAGDQIRTGDGATVTLPLFDGSALDLAANTEISLEIAQPTADGGGRVIVLQQKTGRIHYEVQTERATASRFEINTPTATILVRGTVFDTEVQANGATRVYVSQGQVAVRAQGSQVEVSPGQAAHVEPGAPPLLAGATTTMPASQPTPTPFSQATQVETPAATVTAAATATLSPTPLPTPTYLTIEAGPPELPDPDDVPGLPTDVPGPPTDVPGPPTDVPGPPTDVPGPPTDVPGPPTDVPGPPTDVPGPPTDVPGPPTDVPGPPTDVPGPPTDVPGPPTGVPGPPTGVPGPPTDVPGPPTGVPGPPTGVPGGPPGAPGPTHTPEPGEGDSIWRSAQQPPEHDSGLLLLLAATFLTGGAGVGWQATVRRHSQRPPR